MEEQNKLEYKLNRLKEIVKEMQNNRLDFDKNVELFKEGQELLKECRAKLGESELMLKNILEEQSGANA